MTPLKITPLPGCTPGTAEKIDALNRKLGSFIHAPLNLKEVLRMEPFAADAEVVRAVAVSLDNYAILPTSTEECERQRTTGLPKDYDIVGFWYCVALLALSAEPEAVRYLLVLARILMVEDPAELFLLRRIVRLLEGFPFSHLQELRSRIEGFYDTVTHQLEAFRWLEAAGIPWPESYEWEVIAQFSFDGEPYADPAAPKEERRRRVVLTLRLNSPRSLYGSCRQHNSYEISLRNEDNTTRGMWNEGHGDLFIEDRPVMQHRMFTPLQLPELFDALEGFGIRLVRKPVMVYTSQGIRNAHVKVFQMLEDQLGHKPSAFGQAAEEALGQPEAADDADGMSAGKAGKGQFPEVERAVEEALDLLKYDGDVNDSLAEMRKKWGEEISVLHDARFDEIGVQYACRSHEEGLAAVGQELTCHGYRLYDLDGDGTSELLLGADWGDGCGVIFNIYRLDGAKAVRVVDGWSRSQYFLCSDGTLAHEWSGGADHWGRTYLRYGETLLPIESVFDRGGVWYHAKGLDALSLDDTQLEGRCKVIPRAEAEKLMERYTKQYEAMPFTPFAA